MSGWAATARDTEVAFTRAEVTGAIGDVATVLPIVVAVAALTELSLAMMLVWFGLFQLVWGLYYGLPMSVEPMKALAALVLARTISAGELLLAGLMLGGVLLAAGARRGYAHHRRQQSHADQLDLIEGRVGKLPTGSQNGRAIEHRREPAWCVSNRGDFQAAAGAPPSTARTRGRPCT